MKWSMDTHKFMSEITRKALQIMVAHGVTSESEPEVIEATENELADAGIYRSREGAKGRIRRALFTYYKAYGCMDDNERLTEIGKLFVENKITVQEMCFHYIVNYKYKDDDVEYYPVQLILTAIKKLSEQGPGQAYISAYDFSELTSCDSVEEVDDTFIADLIEARRSDPIEVNERKTGFDVWSNMMISAGIVMKNSDRNLVVKNHDLAKWILEAYSAGVTTVKGNIVSGIFSKLPLLSLNNPHGNPSDYSDEGKALHAYLFDDVENRIIEKYIYAGSGDGFDGCLSVLGLNETYKAFYKKYAGMEHLVGYCLAKNSNSSIRAIGCIIAAVELPECEKQPEDDTSLKEMDEYQRAAQIIKEHITETGFAIPEDKSSIQQALSTFDSRFNPNALAALTDDNLLQTIFYTSGDNSDALCYWLEAKKEYRNLFGSLAGGSAFKFALFQKRETGNWTTGSPKKPQELSDEEALELGKQIRDKLVVGAALVQQAELHSIEDYEKLDADIRSTIGDQLYNLTWVHKYFAMICPDKLSGFHSADWQCHALRCLKVRPSDKYYVRSGQLSMIENYAGMYYREFFSVLYDKFGGVKQFFRLGTSDGTQIFANAWKQRSVVGLGWKKLGPLTEYISGDGLDRSSVADKLTEMYYPGDARTSSRKVGEIVRFYKADADCVMVAMNGENLIAFIDEIGEYFYDASSEMAHMKPGKWRCYFSADEKLPTKAEGKLTSCTQLSDEDNLMFLYEKYYYGTEEAEDDSADDNEAEYTIVDDEDADAEDRNKRLFRYWMTLQVKADSDSDAGQPYSKTSIDQYVSNVANTPLHGNPGKSVFYTVQIGQVQATIDELENTERENNIQRSAVRKYMQFLIAMKEGNMPLNYKTELESNHERNRIVFGAPGTGKSYALKHDTEEFLKGTSGTMERVTFHTDYTYSQFVGTYKPVSDAGTIKYEFVPGPFMRVFVDAVKSGMTEEPQPHVLVIEEINRAKVAAVFGDIFQLLDRDDDGVSEYDIQTSEDIRKYLAKELGGKPSNYARIRIPNNMFIWATMNSADQGVFPMDTAFKRRWNFEYLGINQNEGEIRGRVMLGTDVVQEDVSWNALRRAINEKLAKEYKVNEDKLMGPFFLSKKVIKTVNETDDTILDSDRFIETFKSKVIMYLYEDAAKQHKHKLFSGCEDTTKYSAVCDSFERIGMQIFGEDFEEVYYKPQEEAQEG